MNTTNKEIKEKEERLLSFKQEVEGLRDIFDAEKYAKQLAHLFLGNGLSLQTILLMAIDFGQQHPQWIPVEERLPKEGQVVLIHTKGNSVSTACYTDGRFDITELLEAFNVTHWMPLPQPPRKEGKK